MSIIPGIETAAPERTETSSGSSGSPSFLPARSSSAARCFSISSARPAGNDFALRMYSTHAAVVMVNPAGTGIPSAVISASPAPFPPRSSRPTSALSEKS